MKHTAIQYQPAPIRFGLFFLAFIALPLCLQAQMQTTFGKNRVQYHKQFEDWLYYETPNFTTYWYGAARNIGQAALQMAEYDFAEVQQFLEYPVSEKIEIIVFSDVTDLKQSNIGSDDIFQTRQGETKVVGNKVFAYFDGNHQHLRVQIREGVAGVMLNAMLFGSNLQEIVQNAVLLNLPPWFTDGLTAYCGDTWNVELDNELRDLVLSGRYKNFAALAKDNQRLAGHAFWYYISLHFGKGIVSNLVYLTRINRSVDAGFLYVLGGDYRRTTDGMMEYFKKRYQEESKITQRPEKQTIVPIKNKRKLPLYNLSISPDGQQIAWVSNDIGRWKVWVQDLQTDKRTCILKGGARNALQATDYNYPVLAWNPDNQRIGIAYESRDVIRLSVMTLANRKKEHYTLPQDYQRLFSISWANPADLVFSAAQSGFSDLFLYHTLTKSSERLTQDFWDDLDATVVLLDNKPGVLFASNRLADTLSPQRMDTVLPLGRFDIFYYDLATRSKELVRITNTPNADERNPMALDSAFFAFLSNESGINNRQAGFLENYTAYNKWTLYLKDGGVATAFEPKQPGEWPLNQVLALLPPIDTLLRYVDSAQVDSMRLTPVIKKRPFTYNQTNSDRSILTQSLSPRTGRLAEIIWRNGLNEFYIKKWDAPKAAPARLTRFRELTLRDLGVSAPKPANNSGVEQTPAPTDPDSPKNNPADGAVFREYQDTVRTVQPGWRFQMPENWTVTPESKEKNTERADESINKVVLQDESFQTMEVIRVEENNKPSAKEIEKDGVKGQTPEVIRFNQSRIIPYRLRFRTDYLSTTMDNSLLFEGLDSYAGSPGGMRTPPPGILLKANFKDLLEDYVVEAGFRLPTSFNGAEYYLWFDNKKKRLDRRIAFYRKTTLNNLPGQTNTQAEPYHQRTNTFLGQYEVRYPIDIFTSLRGTFTLRQDKAIIQSTDALTLAAPDYAEQRAALRLAAVFDNTVNVDMNLKTGTRAKLFVEAVKRFEFNIQPKWDFQFNKGFMGVIGLDARHYQRLDRRSILALRLAGATTFGSERILYYLGGVDNWIFPKFNNNIPIPQNENFAYQTTATHLRGFKQNIRNGNSYALFNSEIRVPIFKYFSRKPVMGNFWRNFQLVGFLDAGTAWQGKNPYSGENPLNTLTLTNGPDGGPYTVLVKVNYFRDPLVVGYGIGARAVLFGMFLRADYGWGVETRVVQKPVFHLALGTDF